MTTANSKLIKKITTIGTNALVGGLIAGGAGAFIGIVSSIDGNFIGATIDKISSKDAELPAPETDVEDAPA